VTLEVRTFSLALEEREDGDGRTLSGLLVPYDTEAQIGSYVETFRRGSFTDADPTKVPLLAQHGRDELPIGRATTLTDTDVGLQAEFRVSKTAAGDDVLQLVRDGAVRGLSVGFVPIENRWNEQRTRVDRLRARLVEASVTAFPAYDGAQIVAVRAVLPPSPARTPRLSLARRR